MAMQTACTMCPTNSHNLLIDFLASTDVNFTADAYKLDSAEKCICLPGYYGSATSASGCRACPLGGFCCACDRAGGMDGANGTLLQQRDCPCIAGVALPVALEERTLPRAHTVWVSHGLFLAFCLRVFGLLGRCHTCGSA